MDPGSGVPTGAGSVSGASVSSCESSGRAREADDEVAPSPGRLRHTERLGPPWLLLMRGRCASPARVPALRV